MEILSLLKKQFQSATDWTAMLVDDFPKERWLESPAPLHTNINWLVGHILADKHFHAVVSVIGKQQGLYERLPLAEYRSLYDRRSNPMDSFDKKPGKEVLLDHLQILDQYALDVLDTLDENVLSDPTVISNPVAKTKLDALTYSFKHQMWHNGQIATLKRILKTN